MSITLNSKAFLLKGNPTPSSALYETKSRGATLPDTLLISHRTSKLPGSTTLTVRNSVVSIQRTFIDAVTGLPGIIQFGLPAKIPSNAPAADIAACLLDLTDYMASAYTARASNIARVTEGTLE